MSSKLSYLFIHMIYRLGQYRGLNWFLDSLEWTYCDYTVLSGAIEKIVNLSEVVYYTSATPVSPVKHLLTPTNTGYPRQTFINTG